MREHRTGPADIIAATGVDGKTTGAATHTQHAQDSSEDGEHLAPSRTQAALYPGG